MQFKKFGKYSVIKKIASGGMADILLSVSLSPTGFGRFVVIKKTLTKFSDNQDFNEMFKNEAKVACNLKHKNITSIYEFGIEKSQFFLTMEYISGKNLREFVKKLSSHNKDIGIDNAVHIIKEVASGLNYAHNAIDSNTGLPLNIIHRDVSPQNIMISFDGEIKLIDFGIAKIADTNLTKAGHLKGKFSYMSPEQAQGDKLDERTDIFCLGIILWELLTGKRLFSSENEMASLKKVRNCNIPSAQKLNPKIPTELNNIVMKALSKNKNLRYKTASRFERELSVFLNRNYPEYSHYNLTFLTKTIYRKEVMLEREKLKIYSSEFKKYINTLNLEKSLSYSHVNFKTIGLDISNRTNNTKDVQLETKTSDAIQKNSQLSLVEQQTSSDYESIEVSVDPISEVSRKSTQSESTFQIQNQMEVSRSQTEAKEATKEEIKKETPQVNQKKEPTLEKVVQQMDVNNINQKNPNVAESISEKFDFNKIKVQSFNSTNYETSHSINTTDLRNTKTPSFLMDSNTFLQKQDYNKKKSTSFYLKIATLSLGVIAFMMGAYFFYFKDFISNKSYSTDQASKGNSSTPNIPSKGNHPSSNSRKATPKSAPITSPTANRKARSNTYANRTPKTIQRQRNVFIKSKPSNASIYIDNKLTSKYTPSMIVLNIGQNQVITIKKLGYHSKSFKPGQSNNINIQLTKVDKTRRNSIVIVD